VAAEPLESALKVVFAQQVTEETGVIHGMIRVGHVSSFNHFYRHIEKNFIVSFQFSVPLWPGDSAPADKAVLQGL